MEDLYKAVAVRTDACIASQHWAKVHQWGQDKDYRWYQSCSCTRCRAFSDAVTREQQEHIARGEFTYVSQIGPP